MFKQLRRILIPLSIIIFFTGVLHGFIYIMAASSFAETPVWLVVLMTVGWILMPSSLFISMSPLRHRLMFLTVAGYIWMGMFAIAFFFACVQIPISLIWIDFPSYWVLIATLVISLWALRINWTGPQVVHHLLKGPEFMRGLRLVQISDLHVGMTILREKWLSRVVDKILATQADILVVTGDLADGPFAETAPMLRRLERISMPKFYITGNHEYIRGGDWEKCLRDLGFQVLHNTHQIISRSGGELLIAGVPDQRVGGFHSHLQSLPDVALRTAQGVGYKILLAHEPSSVFDLKTEKCDLLLAGHTHGGQIFPFGIFVRMAQPVVAGFKTVRGIRVFAHQGTGFWGPPMRWFTRSEIVVFEWS